MVIASTYISQPSFLEMTCIHYYFVSFCLKGKRNRCLDHGMHCSCVPWYFHIYPFVLLYGASFTVNYHITIQKEAQKMMDQIQMKWHHKFLSYDSFIKFSFIKKIFLMCEQSCPGCTLSLKQTLIESANGNCRVAQCKTTLKNV